ncbi:MAG: putative rane protein [Firmicutes bacterium]|nr:putative rane protein [Bacillota bacterium]
MCLLITGLTAAITTIIWFKWPSNCRAEAGELCLMFWGAFLMWLVDGFFSLAAGEPFLNLSLDDTLLGITVVLLGSAAWWVLFRLKLRVSYCKRRLRVSTVGRNHESKCP